MSTKRKRVALSIAEKLKILEELDRGVSGASLARQYNVGTSTISDIKKQRQTIKDYASKLDSEEGSTKRKSMKSAENQELDLAVNVSLCKLEVKDNQLTDRSFVKKHCN